MIPLKSHPNVQKILESDMTPEEKARAIRSYAFDYHSLAGDWRHRQGLPTVEKIRDTIIEQDR